MSLASVLPKGFKASTYTSTSAPAERDNTPLPAGIYTVEITNAEVRALKSGRGTGLSLEFTVIDPAPHARRKVWQNLNIKHDNAQAQEIGLRELSNLCLVLDLDQPDETDLFQKVLRIRTKVKPADNGYEARAEVTGYEPAGVPVPRQAQPTHAQMKRGGTAFDDMDSDIPY